LSRLELAGWIVFLLSGVAFLVSGIISDDWWVIGGSVLFVIGIVAVLAGQER
jgi:small neutral amino acid transporter SnatA (MarC family)